MIVQSFLFLWMTISIDLDRFTYNAGKPGFIFDAVNGHRSQLPTETAPNHDHDNGAQDDDGTGTEIQPWL